MAQRDTIVAGASAGGVEALRTLVSGLPADLEACVLVVLHMPRTGANALAAILNRSTRLTVRAAEAGALLEHGTVLVAQPDHHLVVVDGRVTLTRGPRENGHRPSVDTLFRSAAHALGPRVIGVVLSGSLDDGSAGLVAVRRHGGVAVVQDPADALQPGMPASAIAAAGADAVVPLAELSRSVAGLVGAEVPDAVAQPQRTEDVEVAMAALEPESLHAVHRPGVPAGLSCPDCHGTLFVIDEAGYVRYRCRVGHAWSAESLLAESDSVLEGALWMALRALEEKAALADGMADRAKAREQPLSAAGFRDRAEEAHAAAESIRELLLSGSGRGGQDGKKDDEERPA